MSKTQETVFEGNFKTELDLNWTEMTDLSNQLISLLSTKMYFLQSLQQQSYIYCLIC